MEKKFRAWLEKVGCMVYLQNKLKIKAFFDGTYYLDSNTSTSLAYDIFNESDFELMQFTGRKDKNGKEIYENDIVLFEGEKYKVIFDDGAFCLLNEQRSEIICMYEYRDSDFEVVDNIYENPFEV
jgi:uncharacterized phage protein (TIGR01671 family)